MTCEHISPDVDFNGLRLNGGTGGLILNSTKLNLPQSTIVTTPGLNIGAQDTSGGNTEPIDLVLSNGSTLHSSNLTSSGGVEAVNISATNGLTANTLTSRGSITTQTLLCSGDASVVGNLSAANLVFDSATVDNLQVTGTLTGSTSGNIDVGSSLVMGASKQLTFTNGGYMGAGNEIFSIVGSSSLSLQAINGSVNLGANGGANTVSLSEHTFNNGLTSPGDLVLSSAQGHVTVKQGNSLLVDTISSAGIGDVTLNPLGNVAIAATKTLKVDSIAPSSAGATISFGTNNIGTTGAIATSEIRSPSDLSLNPTGSNVTMPVGKTFRCESAVINSLTSTLATVTTLNTPSITLSNTYANMKALKYCNTTTGNFTGASTNWYIFSLTNW